MLHDIDLKTKVGQRLFICFMAMDVSVKLQKDQVSRMIVFNMVDKNNKADCKLFGATDSQIEMLKDGQTFNAAVDIKPYDRAACGYSCIIYNIEPSSVPSEYFVDWADDLQGSQQIIQDAINNSIETIYGKIAYQIIIKYWAKLAVWPGGKSNHHTKLGDLLTHTAEVVKISEDIADIYNQKYGDNFINKPLLLAAASIHDIGKVSELEVDVKSGHTEYSTEAALSTHIMNIIKEVDIQANQMSYGVQEFHINSANEEEPIKSDEQLKEESEAVALLRHCVAAHHGKLEYGSPIQPSIPEAYVLSKADEISAELYRYNRSYKDLEPGKSISSWISGEMHVTYKENNK